MNDVTHKEMCQIVGIIRNFIDEQNVYDVEDVYLSKHVIENVYSFIAQLCDIVGYKELDNNDSI